MTNKLQSILFGCKKWLQTLGDLTQSCTEWAGAQLLEEKPRWPLWAPVLSGAGIALYFALPVEPPLWPPVLALMGAGAGFFALRSFRLQIFLACICLVLGGLAAAKIRTESVEAPLIERRTRALEVTGTLERIERRADGRRRLTIAVEKLAPWHHEVPVRVRVTVRGENPPLRPGISIKVRAVLMPPPAPALPGGFDFARQAYYERLGGVGYAIGRPEIRDQNKSGWRHAVARLRDHISTRITGALKGQPGAVASAIMTGDRSGISTENWEALRRAGLAHLLAISGLHMTAIAALVFFLVRGGLALIEPVVLTRPIKKWAALAAILAAGAYLVLSGMSISTQRAFLMIFIAMLAVLLDRPVLSMRTVAVAAFVVLALRPESLLHAGFQMSFAAVTALIAVYEVWRRREAVSGHGPPDMVTRAWRWLGGILLTTLVASTAVAPFSVYHFGRFGTYDLVANLLAVPVFTLMVMPLAALSFLAMPFGVEASILWALGGAIDAILWVARMVSGWPSSAVFMSAIPPLALGVAVAGGLWLALWRRRWRFAGLALVILGIGIAVISRPPDVLISRDASRIAVRDGNGRLAFAASHRLGFEVQQWLRSNGEDPFDPGHAENTAASPWRCDEQGCTARTAGGRLLAYAKSHAALETDCLYADILISRVPVMRPCSGPAVIIGRFDVWRQGAHAVWLDRHGSTARSARRLRGERPWVLPRLK